MQTDKDKASAVTEQASESTDSSQEATLNWLMEELEKDEPGESLFVVDRQEPADTSLSAFEVEIAARPMTRGRAGADEFDSYVAEEIVISSEGTQSDIYSGFEVEEPEDDLGIEEIMALDFSHRNHANGSQHLPQVEDGADILGLEDDDDIGDTYLVVKRVKREEPAAQTAQDSTSPGGTEGEAAVSAAEPTPAAQATESPQATAMPLEPDSAVSQPAAPESVAFESATPQPAAAQHANEIAAAAGEFPTALEADAAATDRSGNEADDGADAPAFTAGVGDVSQYIADNLPPSDDEDFDAFLVAGSQLAAGDEQIEELTLATEDDSFLDAGPDEIIDYPEEIHALAEEGEDLLSAVTPLLSNLMEELEGALSARLEALGKAPGAVLSDLSLATDATSENLARSQGYAPLMQICEQVPDALSALSSAHLGAIYLRLSWVENGETCNDLFRADAAPAEDEFAQLALSGEHDHVLPETGEFGEGIFEETYDEVFALEEFSADQATSPGADEPASPAGEEEPLPAHEAPGLSLVEPEPEPAPDVFGEGVFDDELFDASLEGQAAPSDDIEALIDELDTAEQVGDGICGIEVEEFAASDEIAEAEPIPSPHAGEAPEPAVAAADERGQTEASAPADSQDMSWCIPEGITFSHSSPSGGEIFAEFLDAFVEEGTSELEKLEDAVAAWESEVGSEDAYKVVTRILHTIKGIAKGVGLHYYGTLIHNFETLLEGMARPEVGAEQTYFRIVNAWLDAAVRGLDRVREQRCDISSEFPQREEAPGEETAAPLAEAQPGPSPVEVGPEAAAAAALSEAPTRDSARKAQDKQLADEGARALAAQQSVRITSEKLDLLLNLSNQAQQLGVRTAQSAARNKRTSAELQARLSSVRSHIADIADRALFNVTAKGGAGQRAEMDALEMDRYSELQEAANILREGVEDLAELIEIASRNNAQAEALLKQQASVISTIGSSIRAARVVPVSRLMPGLRRLVRTVSNDLGKDVAFRVANEVGTLDRDDYTRCQTILEHMVRNAMDHGIESAAERLAAGKPSVGQITVDVRMSGSDSVIVLSDDGRGIDPNALRESALRKGLDVDVHSLSDEEALRLIFHRGFSTAQSVSQISGRGVGMDIVLSELQEMGGEVQIQSEVGRGTSFRIRIPSNVTVNGALLVTAGESSYAIPLGGLIAVDEVPLDDFFAAVESGDVLRVGGLECEPAYLGTLCRTGNLPERSTWRRSVPVILAGSESRYMAIAIDDVEEALELVIRSLGAQFAAVPGVAGAATTADGEAVVALDLNLLVASYAEGRGASVSVDEAEEERFLALVVDDSRTQRMVATSQLETVGIETATAENGAVAIDWLNTTEQLPDVILLDVEMPVKDGIQTLREIRKSARYSHVPVIMVTSRTGVKHRTLAEEAGCNGYMGKPFNFRMLIGQINELTGHRLQLG